MSDEHSMIKRNEGGEPWPSDMTAWLPWPTLWQHLHDWHYDCLTFMTDIMTAWHPRLTLWQPDIHDWHYDCLTFMTDIMTAWHPRLTLWQPDIHDWHYDCLTFMTDRHVCTADRLDSHHEHCGILKLMMIISMHIVVKKEFIHWDIFLGTVHWWHRVRVSFVVWQNGRSLYSKLGPTIVPQPLANSDRPSIVHQSYAKVRFTSFHLTLWL